MQLLWFKKDLRVEDHEALFEASRCGPVLCLFVFEPEILESPEFERSHFDFLEQSLEELRKSLRELGGELLTRVGEAVAVMDEIWHNQRFDALWSHEETGNWLTYRRDLRVKKWCRERGIPWHEFRQFGVVRRLRTRNGWSQAWEKAMARPMFQKPEKIVAAKASLASMRVDFSQIKIAGSPKMTGLRGGEMAARETLDSFLQRRGVNYRREMSSPVTGFDACSRISPYLTFGCVSMRTVSQFTRQRVAEIREEELLGREIDRRWFASLRSFEARLRWHCHFMQKLEDEPRIEFENFARSYDGLREEFTESEEGRQRFAAWCEGQTGYPMIDACIRCVRTTGWLNFRMRAMLVSFASYHLWLHWRPTAVWLAKHFLDFEPGIHFSQFQMQSGTTGINALRIYSPAKQALDQDPSGIFLRQWLPELAAVPTHCLTQPELMTSDLQAQAGFRPGRDYPLPIVDHRTAYREARAKMGEVRRKEEAKSEARRVYVKHGSRKKSGSAAVKQEWKKRGISSQKHQDRSVQLEFWPAEEGSK